MKYRPEIDGLRAIAVVGAIGFHAAENLLTGGFLGVDVFFVISGFLITTIIATELEKGKFSIGGFYKRRVRRILPVYIAVAFISSLYAWKHLFPGDLQEYSKSLQYSLAFISNYWFYAQDNYHASEAALKPLLHTWSLSIEEQFYLIFPLILIALKTRSEKLRLMIIGVLVVASFVVAATNSKSSPDWTFYLIYSRFWELGLGAILALLVLRKKPMSNRGLAEMICVLGIFAIVLSLFVFSETNLHPSYITLVPTLGTVFVIFAGENSRAARILLGNQAMAWFGRLSYSLYLWHFPVLAFLRIRNAGDPLSGSEVLKALCITLILSLLSYYFIENKTRGSKALRFKPLLASLTIAYLALILWTAHIEKTAGAKYRLGDIEGVFAGTQYGDSFLKVNGKRCVFDPGKNLDCKAIEMPGQKVLINLGDSHANAISKALFALAEKRGMNFLNMTLSHCPYVYGAWRHSGFGETCSNARMVKVRNFLLSIEPATIVYTMRLPYYIESQAFDNGEGGKENSLFFPFNPTSESLERKKTVPTLIRESIEELAQYGHQIILVYPIPEVGWHIPKLFEKRISEVNEDKPGAKMKAFREMNVSTDFNVYKRRSKKSVAIYDSIHGTNITRVYPYRLFCSDKTSRCVTHNKDTLFYYDDDHLSLTGSKLLVDEIEAAIWNSTIESR